MKLALPCPPGRSYLPFQESFIRYAVQGYHAGATGTLLADEMGLGKTIQAIGVINALLPKRCVIVAPKGLILNWRNELNDWLTPEAHAKSFFGLSLVTYHQAEQITDDLGPIDMLIVDEAHYIKHADSKRSKCIARLGKLAKCRLALTGTPIDASPIDLWPLLKMLDPKTWETSNIVYKTINPDQKKSHPDEGPAFWAYARHFCNAAMRSRPRPGGGFFKAWDFSGAAHLDELNRKLRASCMVRRLKRDVLKDLPEKRRQVVVLDVGRTNDDDLLSDLSFDNYETSVAKLAAGSALFNAWSKRRHEQALAKVDAVVTHVSDVLDNPGKVILFAHHADVIAQLAERLGEHAPEIVTGLTNIGEREYAVRRFQKDPACRLFIGSIGAAGVGITLTAAETVVFAELDPMPSRMSQAEDRAHRIGLRNMVLVQHLVTNGSLCARMAKILVKKQAVITAAIDDGSHLDVEADR